MMLQNRQHQLSVARRSLATRASALPHYADLPLDKASHLRTKPEELRRLFNRDDAKLVVFNGRDALVLPIEGADAAKAAGGQPSAAAVRETAAAASTSSGSAHTGQTTATEVADASATDPALAATQAASAAQHDAQSAWQLPEVKWRPAYIQPARDAAKYGYLNSVRNLLLHYDSAQGGSVSHEGAIFLGLDSESQQPFFAANLGEAPPLWPDSSAAIQSLAASPAFDTFRSGLQVLPAGNSGNGSGAALPSDRQAAAEFLQRQQMRAVAADAAAHSNSDAAAGSAEGTSAQQLESYVDSIGGSWVDVRRQGPHMSGGDAAIMAFAGGLLTWHRNNAFAGGNGAPLTAAEGGFSRKLVALPEVQAKPLLYPRIDPAVIMLVACGDSVLLGRQSRWVEGRYSLLAGFVEIGETLEQAVVREVLEEAGVNVAISSVAYHSSQPWPFPQSLMLGFTAQAAVQKEQRRSGLDALGPQGRSAALGVGLLPEEVDAALGPPLPAVAADQLELEDARWFHRSWLKAALSGDTLALAGRKFAVPGIYSLAGRIVSQWTETEGSSSKGASALESVRELQLDEGTFKYVLLRVSDAGGNSKVVVRGHRAAPYHNDLLTAVARKVAPQGLQVDVLGGGRIEHNTEAETVNIFGYSSAFGPAPHEVTAALIRRWLPFYDPANITTSYEGY